MYKKLGEQLRKPSGLSGVIVSKMMDSWNKEFYKKIIFNLDIKKDDKIFEIGYGPGLGINLIAKMNIGCTISGLDYSELMQKKAIKRNQKFVDGGIVHLKYGDILFYEVGNEKFDKVFCVNVIYFWNDLNKVFQKIYSMLSDGGMYSIYMDHEKDFEKLKFTKDFCRYSIENVESELKGVGFTKVEYILDKGYFIKAIK